MLSLLRWPIVKYYNMCSITLQTCTPVDVQQVDVSEVGVLDFYYPFCALVQF